MFIILNEKYKYTEQKKTDMEEYILYDLYEVQH